MTQIMIFLGTKVIFFNWLYDFASQIAEIMSLSPIRRFDNLLIAVTIV